MNAYVMKIRGPVTSCDDWTDRLAAIVGAASAFGELAPLCVPLGARAASWEEVVSALDEGERVALAIGAGLSPATWTRHQAGALSLGDPSSEGGAALIDRAGRVLALATLEHARSVPLRAAGAEAMPRVWGSLGLAQAAAQIRPWMAQ